MVDIQNQCTLCTCTCTYTYTAHFGMYRYFNNNNIICTTFTLFTFSLLYCKEISYSVQIDTKNCGIGTSSQYL